MWLIVVCVREVVRLWCGSAVAQHLACDGYTMPLTRNLICEVHIGQDPPAR